MRVRALSTFTSKGARPAQEDFVLNAQEKGIFVIADGFGGPAPGSQASRSACEAVRSFLVKEAGDQDATLPFVIRNYFSLAGNVLFNALIHANRKLCAANRGKGVHERGGASVLAGYLDGDLLALANVGGCTAWLVREGRAIELVTPRTYGRLRDPFAPDATGATGRCEAGVPLTAAGISDDLEPEIFETRVRAGDWLILHTDGVASGVRQRIVGLQAQGLGPSAASDQAITELNSVRFEDNASLSLVIF